MTKKRWAVVLFAALAAILAVGAPVLAAPIIRTATLTGESEVPGPGDPDGSGMARFNVVPAQNRLCYSIKVSNIAPATMAHVHRGRVGVAGPVLFGVKAPTDGSSSGCANVARERLLDIARNPSLYYVNIHNRPYANKGAVRGQLSAR